jgi:hypothetical protein
MQYPEYDHYEKIYKRTTTFLSRWNGGTAIMKELTISHATLFIDIYKEGSEGWLQLACIDPQWIQGSKRWENCEIELKVKAELKRGEIGYIVSDAKAELEIHCGAFESSEHLPKKRNSSK